MILGIPSWAWFYIGLLMLFSLIGLAILTPHAPNEPEQVKVRPTSHYEIAASPGGEFLVVYVVVDAVGPRHYPRKICKTRTEAEAYRAECLHSDSVNAARRIAGNFTMPDGSVMPREEAEKIQGSGDSRTAKEQVDVVRKVKAADPSKHK